MRPNSLQKDFALRKEFFANRSSAVFPVYFRSKNNDLVLSWLNYWTIKNGLEHSNLAINIRVYDHLGALVMREKVELEEQNNTLSVRSFLDQEVFEGMIEIEIISTENIRFTFPAVIGFYKSGSLYSCVHSAGRFKNSDENHSEVSTEETNWNCKFTNDITPFFHYINGCVDTEVKLKVNLKSQDGSTISHVDISAKMNAFGSKVFFIDEIMPGIMAHDGMFVSVECLNNGVFRRMVVGNYYKRLQHMEVTHSFPKQYSIDYCPKNDCGSESFLALYNDSKLTLTARVFPTNCLGKFSVKESNQPYYASAMDDERVSLFLPEGYGFIDLEEQQRCKVLWLYGESVPSRLNCNFIYRVKDSESLFSTDIATGAKSSVYPPKHSHWGSGVFGNGYDFALMIRNLRHNHDSMVATGKLLIYGLGAPIENTIEINAEASRSILLSDIIDPKLIESYSESEIVFTWLLKLDRPDSETFWVSFRERDGAIVGEHGF